MRRQPLGSGPVPLNTGGYDDLGWNDMGYDVDPDQSDEPARMLDLKLLLTGSVLSHNVEADHAVRPEERRAGKGWVSTCRLRLSTEAAQNVLPAPISLRSYIWS